MFQKLLTPLRSRFELSPLSPSRSAGGTLQSFTLDGAAAVAEDELAPEDFARDVLIELMRNSVENLKTAEGAAERAEVLTEIQRIMLQESKTKDVFRELDGFLVLMSVLSAIQATSSTAKEDEARQVLEGTRLVFMILSEAMNEHLENEEYFISAVGYESLAHALSSLVTDPNTVDESMGFLLSLSLHDFALSGVFTSLRGVSEADIEIKVTEFQSRLGVIRFPGALEVFWSFLPHLTNGGEDRAMRYGVFKLFELLAARCHRNQAILSTLPGLVQSLLDYYLQIREEAGALGSGPASASLANGKEKGESTGKEKHVLQRLLKRLLDMGATTNEARYIFQRTITQSQPSPSSQPQLSSQPPAQTQNQMQHQPPQQPTPVLDQDLLEIIRSAIKSRWVEHISMEDRARVFITQEHVKGLPAGGFTFSTWLYLETLPKNDPHPLLTIRTPTKNLVILSIRQDGHLQLLSSVNRDVVVLDHGRVGRGRWVHVVVVWWVKGRGVRIFIDGVQTDTLNWTYPKPESSYQTLEYILGGEGQQETGMSWCLGSTHFVAGVVGDDIPRYIHHLGARYSGNFQDPNLSKFLTYEAATSLNMFLYELSEGSSSSPSSSSSLSSNNTHKNSVTGTSKAQLRAPTPINSLPVMKAVREGIGIPPSSIIFSLIPANAPKSGRTSLLHGSGNTNATHPSGGVMGGGGGVSFVVRADAFVVKASCLDVALWKIGGVPVTLRLVQVANTQHELSRAIGVLTDGVANSWQNSDDMERWHGYEVLADMLRAKAHLINLTCFETLFEFLGLRFRSPEQSTIVNLKAYNTIALDFELWSRTKQEIQTLHLEHFTTILKKSRYKKWIARQCLAKSGIVRRFLFVLQTDWYHHDMNRSLVEALKVVAQLNFSGAEAVKPMVTYLAANLYEEPTVIASPASYVSRIDHTDNHEKAQLVLEMLVNSLSIPVLYTRFSTTLPLARICLLLLGDKPTSFVAAQVLTILAISMNVTQSFARKFELVSGWSVLKTVLPGCWDPNVHEAALDVLLGRIHGRYPKSHQHQLSQQQQRLEQGNGHSNGDGNGHARMGGEIHCPWILPTILAALHTGLVAAAHNCQVSDEDEFYTTGAEATMEVLIEELMDLHTSSAAFRQIFESQQTTKLFVDAYKGFVQKVAPLDINQRTIRLIEKLNHLGLALALDNAVAGSQKREILDVLRIAEDTLNPTAERMQIDPNLVADHRTLRQRIASARLSIQVGEWAILKTINRMVDWRKSITKSERNRLRQSILDLREERRQASRFYDWNIYLSSERGLWQVDQEPHLWRLDETEGPHRVRKKMEPQCEKPSSRVDGTEPVRVVRPPDSETNSVLQVEVPPWNESYEIASTEIDGQLAEDIADDKHRRIKHELHYGDKIDALATVARIVGVDSSPGLLMLGRGYLYMLDGVVEGEDGEIIEAKEAPKALFFVPGSIVELDGPQRAQSWPHNQVVSFSDKTFLFRDVALEIYFKDSRSLLVVFRDKAKRVEFHQRLMTIVGRTETAMTPGHRKTPLLGRVGSRVLMGLMEDELGIAQHKWQAREISNFTYLSILNQVSGRTPSDATQYPVFPWVLRDYSSQTLDLTNPEVFRDLSKPMGAMTDVRREAAQTRYRSLQSVGEPPFHYGTHFSSSMIVCHFLIRMAPFTNMFKTLQGGDWDLPDRLFIDIARAYESAAHDVRGDVRELIPEFYTCPEFLENSANLDFGVQQNNGERIHDVKLPPWARGDPLLFVKMNRRALESEYVSEHLPEWIDLIWGCKQRDPESLNVYHPLSYEGAIDLDSITDELEREATVGIIHNFGQTPRKLFNAPHPNRYNHGLYTLPIGTLHGIEEDPHLLNQGSRAFKDLGQGVAVRELALDMIGEKVIPYAEGVLMVPLHPHEEIEWGFNRVGADELRVVVDHKVVQVVEGAFCTCAAFADSEHLVTGASDHTVRLWRVARTMNGPYAPLRIFLSHIMRIHTAKVVCVTASRPWSIIVSGSEDGSAALWCLNRGTYIRSIWHTAPEDGRMREAVEIVAVNESSGHIATCSKSKLMLHTINARAMATLDLTSLSPIKSLAFHEREYSHLGVLATGAADGTITLRTWTADGTPEGEKAQWEFLEIRKLKTRAALLARGRPPSVTALKFIGESLCHGEETGKAYMWSLPD